MNQLQQFNSLYENWKKKCHVLFWLLWLKIQMYAWNFILPSRKVHIPIHESAYPQARKCILSSINRDRISSNQINLSLYKCLVIWFKLIVLTMFIRITVTQHFKCEKNMKMPFENKYIDCMNILRVWIPLFSIETFLIKIDS